MNKTKSNSDPELYHDWLWKEYIKYKDRPLPKQRLMIRRRIIINAIANSRRKNKPISYQIVTKDGKKHVECQAKCDTGENKIFWIDIDDIDLVVYLPWFINKEGYVYTKIRIHGKKKILYVHNLIMNNLVFEN